MLLATLASCAGAPAERGAGANQTAAAASRLLDAGDFSGAIELLQPAVTEHPRDALMLSQLGEAYWRIGDYAAALNYFESSLRIDYSDYRTHMLLAQMLIEQGKSGRALTEFKLAAEFGSHKALPHYNYGLALFRLGRRDAALEEWQRAYRLEPDNPVYAAALGMAYAGIDDGEALSFFEKAAALGNEDPQFHHNFGVLLERLGEYGRAEEQFRSALDGAPGNGEYLFSLAALHMKRAEWETAIPLWERMAAKEPANRTVRTYQAKAALELGRYGEAAAALDTVIGEWEASGDPAGARAAKGPPLDQALDILAMAYRGLEQWERSLRCIEKAVELAPASTAHRNNYGVILAGNGMIDRAIEQWERVLELDPANEIARRNLAAYRKR